MPGSSQFTEHPQPPLALDGSKSPALEILPPRDAAGRPRRGAGVRWRGPPGAPGPVACLPAVLARPDPDGRHAARRRHASSPPGRVPVVEVSALDAVRCRWSRCPVTGSRAARSAESLTPPGHRGSRSRGMIVLDTIEVPFTDWMDARHHALVVALAWKSCCRSSSRG